MESKKQNKKFILLIYIIKFLIKITSLLKNQSVKYVVPWLMTNATFVTK